MNQRIEEANVTNDVIAEITTDMTYLIQMSNKKPTEYTEASWNLALRGDRVQDKCVLKTILYKEI